MDNRIGIVAVAICTVAFLCADVVLLSQSNVRVSPQNVFELARAAAVAIAVVLVCKLTEWRLNADTGWIADFIRRVTAMLRLVVYAFVLFVPLSFATSLFMFLATATQAPLTDPLLAEVDRSIGFDWIAFHASVSGPVVSTVLIFAYHALAPQVPLVLLYHAAKLDQPRLTEFIVLLAVSAIPTAAGMYLFPAAGAYSFYEIDHGAFTSQAGMWHYDLLTKLRSGEDFAFVATQPSGLTTFPSFHTALGLMIIYSLRSAPAVILLPVTAINAAMIVATVPEGGHHLIDVITGFGVAAVAITVSASLSRRRSGGLVQLFDARSPRGVRGGRV